MSDPVTNAEIEDVLSSIRRLVSEDNRPAKSAKIPVEPDTTSRLVLTPDFRVQPDKDVAEKAVIENDTQNPRDSGVTEGDHKLEGRRLHFTVSAQPDSDTPKNKVEEPSADDRTDLSIEKVMSPNESTGVELQKVQASDETRALDKTKEEKRESRFGARPASEDKPSSSEDVAGASSAKWSVSSLEQTIAELEAVVAKQDVDWEPDGSEVTDEVQIWEDVDEGEQFSVSPDAFEFVKRSDNQDNSEADMLEEDTSEEDAFDEDAFEANASEDDEELDEALEEEVLKARAVEEDNVVEDAVVEEEFEDEDFADEAFDDNEFVEEEFAEDAIEDDSADDESDPTLYDEESVIDEDTLRDMVSDIVRQELQGALGERITRNVRKLVRREIHRALSSKDFE